MSVEACWHWVRGSVCSALCVCARHSTQAERCEGATLSKETPNKPAGMAVDRVQWICALAGQATKARSRSLSPCSISGAHNGTPCDSDLVGIPCRELRTLPADDEAPSRDIPTEAPTRSIADVLVSY